MARKYTLARPLAQINALMAGKETGVIHPVPPHKYPEYSENQGCYMMRTSGMTWSMSGKIAHITDMKTGITTVEKTDESLTEFVKRNAPLRKGDTLFLTVAAGDKMPLFEEYKPHPFKVTEVSVQNPNQKWEWVYHVVPA